jgi:hypothetical protein
MVLLALAGEGLEAE